MPKRDDVASIAQNLGQLGGVRVHDALRHASTCRGGISDGAVCRRDRNVRLGREPRVSGGALRTPWLRRREQITYQGRRIKVAPAPHTPGGPVLMWGGGSLPQRAAPAGMGSVCSPTPMCPACKKPVRQPAASTAMSRGRRCCRRALHPRCVSSPTTSTRRGMRSVRICCTTRAPTPNGTLGTRHRPA